MITCPLNDLSSVVKKHTTKDSPFATVFGIGLFVLLLADACLISFGKPSFVVWLVSMIMDLLKGNLFDKYGVKLFFTLAIDGFLVIMAVSFIKQSPWRIKMRKNLLKISHAFICMYDVFKSKGSLKSDTIIKCCICIFATIGFCVIFNNLADFIGFSDFVSKIISYIIVFLVSCIFGWLVAAVLFGGNIDRNTVAGIFVGIIVLLIGSVYSPDVLSVFGKNPKNIQELELLESLIFVVVGFFLIFPVIQSHSDVTRIEVKDFDKYQKSYYDHNPVGLQFDAPLHIKVNHQDLKIIVLSRLLSSHKKKFVLEDITREIPIHDRIIRVWSLSSVEKDANFSFDLKHANGYFSISGKVYFTPTTVVSDDFIKAEFDEAVVNYASHTLFANPDLKEDLKSALYEAFDEHLQDISKGIDETIQFISRFNIEKLGLVDDSICHVPDNDLIQTRKTAMSLAKEVSNYQRKIQEITSGFKELRIKLAREWEAVLVMKFKDHCKEADKKQLDQFLVFLKLLGLKLNLGEPSLVGAASDLMDQLKQCSIDMKDRVIEKEGQRTKEKEDKIAFERDIIKDALNRPDARDILDRLSKIFSESAHQDRPFKSSTTNIDPSLIHTDDDILE